ncbi:MAG: shikimate dehydrogenase [Campylobacteraceae bacterium]|nr:shikimate dehydrogenase [Campylobacteraceae bacterium]
MKKFAVFGNPISHSISPRLHNLAIKELSLDAFYGRVLLDDGLNLKEKFNLLNLNGANITVPFKEDALNACDYLDEGVKVIGSLNTIVKKDGKIYGYNTDAPGFLKAIKEFGNIKSALIIGAGGTAKALSYALKDLNLDIVNRSDKRAANFKDFNFYTWKNFTPKGYDLVVNSTSAGLKDEELPMPKEVLEATLKSSKFAFDVIYGKETPFLSLAKSLNLKTKDGLDMLIFQAVVALNLFYDKKLDENKIEVSMKKAANLR